MSYFEQQAQLKKIAQKLPPQVLAVLPDPDLVFLVGDICGTFELTMGQIGELCELVRQVIAKERKPEDFQTGVKEKLPDEDQNLVDNVAAAIIQKIFLKLLPALGIKVPLDMVMAGVTKPGAPAEATLDVTLGEKPLEQSFITPAKTITPDSLVSESPATPPAPAPPVSSELTTSNLPARLRMNEVQAGGQLKTTPPIHVMPEQPRPKAPMVEVSHEALAENPMESLVQMLGDKVSEKELTKRFEKLPESLKTALNSVDSAKKVVDVGRKHALHVDKIAELGAETGMVILGFTHPADFLRRLTRRLGLPEEKVRPIAQEINTEVFLKIREALKEVHGEAGAEIPPKTGSTSAPITGPRPEPPRPVPAYNLLNLRESPAAKRPPFSSEPPKPPAPQPSAPVDAESDAALDREAILRDIENPTPVRSSPLAPAAPTTEKIEKSIESARLSTPHTDTSEKTPAEPEPPIEPPSYQGPSLIKPVGAASVAPAIQPPTTAPSAVVPETKSTAPAEEKTSGVPTPPRVGTPTQTPTSSPSVGAPPPADIISQKLSGTTASTKSESHYSTDPYREPIG